MASSVILAVGSLLQSDWSSSNSSGWQFWSGSSATKAVRRHHEGFVVESRTVVVEHVVMLVGKTVWGWGIFGD